MNEENSLWMGDISPDIEESKISQFFQFFNIIPINVKLIKDKKTNTHKNYCFVSFKNLEDANNALNQLNGKSIPNTNMTFKLKKAFYHSPINRPIYVGNLNKSISNELLLNFFQMRYNSASKATIIKEKGISKGYGFVVFKKENEYKKSLIEMNGVILEGNKIIVREQKRKDEEEMSNNNSFINKINYNNNINNFCLNNDAFYKNGNSLVNNNINKDILINYQLRNNVAINDYSILKKLNIFNNNNNNKLLKNEYQNDKINNYINNGVININKNIVNQNNNIINFINYENKNVLYGNNEFKKNYINNDITLNRDKNKILLMKNNNINDNLINLNKQYLNKIDNNKLYNNVNNSININMNKNQNIIKKNNNINNRKQDYNNNKINMAKINDYINSKANLKRYNKLEILENFDEKTLIKKINDSINSTFYHYKKLYFTNGSNNIKSKYNFIILK